MALKSSEGRQIALEDSGGLRNVLEGFGGPWRTITRKFGL